MVQGMQINRRFLSWGVFFILVGAVPLAVQAGALSPDQVASWWSFWPLLIVGVGLGLVLGRTPLEFLGGLVVAATFGLMVGAFVAVGGSGFPGSVCGSDAGSERFQDESGSFDGEAQIDLQINCGELELTGVAGTAWSFAGRGDADSAPSVSAEDDSLRVRSREGGARFAFVGKREQWEVSVPTGVPLSLEVQLNAGQATLAPATAELRDVDVEFNAGSVRLDLGSVRSIESLDVQGNAGAATLILPDVSFTGQFQVNAGSIAFCAPPGAALRIRAGSNPVAAYDLDREGLVRSGDTWQSPDFDSAAVRIDLRVEANAGSITLNPEDGCDD
jgi:hypothetical protein